MLLKRYREDIIPGLKCELKTGKRGQYYVFIENNKIKWWLLPVGGTLFMLYHKKSGKGRHSQRERGKPHELMTYIARHEAYERGFIPPLYHCHLDLGEAVKILCKGPGPKELKALQKYRDQMASS